MAGINSILYGMFGFWYEISPTFLRTFIHRKRKNHIIRYAYKYSDFYKKLYKDCDLKNIDYAKLPITSKQLVMEHFDEIVTDHQVHLSDILDFMTDTKNVGKKYLGKYVITETSGTTWRPVIIPYDERMLRLFDLAFATRMYRKDYPYVALVSDAGFSLGNSSLRKDVDSNGKYYLIDSVAPIQNIVKQLNEIQPKHIQSFPGTLEMLLNEQEAGRLHIAPKRICTTGENLSLMLRNRIKTVFHCKVYSIYSSTETGHIATDCEYGHLHYFDDYLEIEAVDDENQRVDAGVESDKILVTNLASRALPLIRYEMSDRIILHQEKCPCGSKHPWMEVMGRTGDRTLTLKKGDEKIVIPFLTMKKRVIDDELIRSMQLILHNQEQLEIRLKTIVSGDKKKEYQEYEDRFLNLFSEYGVDHLKINLTEKDPIREEKSGKVKPILYKIGEQE